LQSEGWEDFQKALGRKTSRIDQILIIEEKGRFTSRLYLPYAPNFDKTEQWAEFLPKLINKAKELKMDYIRFDPISLPPTQIIQQFKIVKANHDVQPANTLVNSLEPTEEEIFANVSQLPRRIWRKCEKAGIEFEVSHEPQDIEYFLSFIHEVEDRTGMKAHSDNYFQTMAQTLFPTKTSGLLFAKLNGEKVAAIIFGLTKNVFYYFHAGSKTEFRKLSPATALALYALKYAKLRGCRYFDFFGAAPEGTENQAKWASWQGFTKFKLSFHGQRVSYPGSYEIPVRYLKYKLFSLLTKGD
jgi:lipid II:glycine glycyltransferase (peptidoglycan interpeptide bridge formation enzyme)